MKEYHNRLRALEKQMKICRVMLTLDDGKNFMIPEHRLFRVLQAVAARQGSEASPLVARYAATLDALDRTVSHDEPQSAGSHLLDLALALTSGPVEVG